MRKKLIFPILLLMTAFIQIAFAQEQIQVGYFELTVLAKKFPDSTKVILYNRNIGENIDSAYVINEQFMLNGKVDVPSLCYLYFYNKAGERLEVYKYFYLENRKMSIHGELSDFQNATVEGSYQSDLSTKYNLISKNSDVSVKTKKEIEFLFSNANNQMAITNLLFKKKTVPKDSLLIFYKRLDSFNANSPKGKELYEYANTIDIKVGDKIRDIIGKDLSGKEHKLSDYSGKVILLDFWGGGCYPCRLQNKKEFPKVNQKFSADNFVLISYSLDTDRGDWERFSREDNLTWINITDLKGMKGENVKKYAVTAIPNSFLIDQNGVVVKSFVGFVDGQNIIEKEIEKLLK